MDAADVPPRLDSTRAGLLLQRIAQWLDVYDEMGRWPSSAGRAVLSLENLAAEYVRWVAGRENITVAQAERRLRGDYLYSTLLRAADAARNSHAPTK